MTRIVSLSAADVLDVYKNYLIDTLMRSISDSTYTTCLADVTSPANDLEGIGDSIGRATAEIMGTTDVDELAFLQMVATALLKKSSSTLSVSNTITYPRQIKLWDEASLAVNKFVSYYSLKTWIWRFDGAVDSIFNR